MARCVRFSSAWAWRVNSMTPALSSSPRRSRHGGAQPAQTEGANIGRAALQGVDIGAEGGDVAPRGVVRQPVQQHVRILEIILHQLGDELRAPQPPQVFQRRLVEAGRGFKPHHGRPRRRRGGGLRQRAGKPLHYRKEERGLHGLDKAVVHACIAPAAVGLSR